MRTHWRSMWKFTSVRCLLDECDDIVHTCRGIRVGEIEGILHGSCVSISALGNGRKETVQRARRCGYRLEMSTG